VEKPPPPGSGGRGNCQITRAALLEEDGRSPRGTCTECGGIEDCTGTPEAVAAFEGWVARPGSGSG
jgi:hypothetical protein